MDAFDDPLASEPSTNLQNENGLFSPYKKDFYLILIPYTELHDDET